MTFLWEIIGHFRSRRMRSIVVDPGIYLAARRDIFIGTQKRPFPTSYRFSTGEIILNYCLAVANVTLLC